MTDVKNDADADPGEFYPEFHTVRRGYDPDEVEQVLDDLYTSLNDAVGVAEARATATATLRAEQQELKDALASAQRRIAELESHPAGGGEASFQSLGARISEILEAATAEAAEITRRATADAQALHDESEASAVTTRAETDHYASDTRVRAEREAGQITEQARSEAAQILDEARVLREHQERADAEAFEKLSSELAERQAKAEADFADETAAHERRIAALSARLDGLTEELAQARGVAQAEIDDLLALATVEAATMTEEAHRLREEAIAGRARVRAQLAEVRARLGDVLASPTGSAEATAEATATSPPVSEADPTAVSADAPRLAVATTPPEQEAEPRGREVSAHR